jgi:hypothetical protein
MRPVRRLVAALVLAFVAGPAVAYTIYLKDGSRIVARDKYEIQGELAIITLPSGTRSSMPADQIDVPRTEKANESRLGGTAMVIEGGQATELQQAPPPPPAPKLTDLLRQSEGALRGPVAAPAPAVGAPQTPAAALRARESTQNTRAPYPDTALAAEIRQILSTRGAGGAAVLRGARANRPLLVFETSSEASVFKAILASSNALLQLKGQRPDAVEGFEVVCETAGGQSGGRFELTPDLADQIVSRRYEITRFFVENVQF